MLPGSDPPTDESCVHGIAHIHTTGVSDSTSNDSGIMAPAMLHKHYKYPDELAIRDWHSASVVRRRDCLIILANQAA
jgi:hypothetical protein